MERLFSSCPDECLGLEQDKAVKRFVVRNMIEKAAESDLMDASVYKQFKVWNILLYSIDK